MVTSWAKPSLSSPRSDRKTSRHHEPLWKKAFDDAVKARFINNVARKMEAYLNKEILKRQIAIFREVHPNITTRLEKATGIKSDYKVSEIRFNGTNNEMVKDKGLRSANGTSGKAQPSVVDNNDPPKVRGISPWMLSGVYLQK
jgi:catalase